MMYDEENMVQDLENLFKAELNNCIAAVNLEKGAVDNTDPRFLADIPTDKYVFDTLNKSMLNYKGFFVKFGIADTPIKQQQTGNYLEDLTVYFEVATFDNGRKNLNDLMYTLLRYRRALKSVINKNPDVFRGYAQPLVGSLRPTAFPYDRNVAIISIGIEIKASVTAQ